MVDLWSEAKISPKGKLNTADLKKLGLNLLKFVAPTLGVFFNLLAQGVPFEKAWVVAALGIYQAISDFFSKLNDGSK